jgi:hypothetical protein
MKPQGKTNNHKIMKTKLLILIVLLFSFQTIFAQSRDDVSAIRNQVSTINRNLRKYTKKTKDVEDISVEGAQATYYTSGRGLLKVSVKMYGETYNAIGDFYYQGEELIFAYVKLNRYDTQIGLKKAPKVVKVEEKRLYFTDGNLVKLLIGQRQIKASDEKFNESKSEITDISGKLKAAFD